jgi:hypothetical protein
VADRNPSRNSAFGSTNVLIKPFVVVCHDVDNRRGREAGRWLTMKLGISPSDFSIELPKVVEKRSRSVSMCCLAALRTGGKNAHRFPSFPVAGCFGLNLFALIFWNRICHLPGTSSRFFAASSHSTPAKFSPEFRDSVSIARAGVFIVGRQNKEVIKVRKSIPIQASRLILGGNIIFQGRHHLAWTCDSRNRFRPPVTCG